MRAVLVVSLLAFFCPAIAMAQSQTAPAATPSAAPASPAASAAPKKGGGDITRDEYIERAKRSAEKRFDRMDTDHDGVLTLEERRAARTKRRSSTSQ